MMAREGIFLKVTFENESNEGPRLVTIKGKSILRKEAASAEGLVERMWWACSGSTKEASE